MIGLTTPNNVHMTKQSSLLIGRWKIKTKQQNFQQLSIEFGHRISFVYMLVLTPNSRTCFGLIDVKYPRNKLEIYGVTFILKQYSYML